MNYEQNNTTDMPSFLKGIKADMNQFKNQSNNVKSAESISIQEIGEKRDNAVPVFQIRSRDRNIKHVQDTEGDFQEQKPVIKTTTISNDSNEVLAFIPDLDDVEQEEITTQIAAAPNKKQFKVTTIKELEVGLMASNSFLHESNIPGIDLSILAKKCLCPFNQVVVTDSLWEWDVIFAQISE